MSMTATIPALDVEVVCTSGPVPLVASGRARFEHGLYIVDLDTDASMTPVGGKAILSFASIETPRVIARVESALGNRLTCSPEQHRNRERRDFPRLHAGLPVRVRRLAVTERRAESASWLAGDAGPAERGEWLVPDRFVDFSVTGLRLHMEMALNADDLLLLELGLPNDPTRWRCTARVIRIFDEPDGMSAAVEFESIPDGARTGLSQLTLRIQEQLLDDDGLDD